MIAGSLYKVVQSRPFAAQHQDAPDREIKRVVVRGAVLIEAGGASAADATVISVQLSQALSNSGSYSGSFDLTNYLTDANGNQFALTSASLTKICITWLR